MGVSYTILLDPYLADILYVVESDFPQLFQEWITETNNYPGLWSSIVISISFISSTLANAVVHFMPSPAYIYFPLLPDPSV